MPRKTSAEDDDPPYLHPKRVASPKATCPVHQDPHWRGVLRNCWKQGAWIQKQGNNHFKVLPPPQIVPPGAQHEVAYIACTGHHRGHGPERQMAALRRLGFVL